MTLTDVIIPAFNEEHSIGKVIVEIPKDLVNEIIVIDNNSTDDTSNRAREAGATVLSEFKQGYGHACLKGIDYVKSKASPPEIVVFMDGDHSDYPEELPLVTEPIIKEDYDMVIGSRARGIREKHSMTPQQIYGNMLSTRLMNLFYGTDYTDLGPFRAIKLKKLLELGMSDKTYGWTIEMQIRAAKMKMKTIEVPVSYRQRIGQSKVSGTLKGTIFAGTKILYSIFKYM